MKFNRLFKTNLVTVATLAFLLVHPLRFAMAAPTAVDARKTLNAQLQKLKPAGYTQRTVLFETVTPGTPNGGYYPFIVTATIHDYGPGYPANRFYGDTCVGKMDKWKFDLRDNGSGGWVAQGRMTVPLSDSVCQKNPSEGVAAVAVGSLPGKPAEEGAASPPARKGQSAVGNLYLGEYACYGTGGRLMAGMGFRLLASNRYTDLDGSRGGGSYSYDAGSATLSFSGGFLDGQKGGNVKITGFQISRTVNCEPWR